MNMLNIHNNFPKVYRRNVVFLRRETGSFKWERPQEGDFNFYFIPFYYVQTFNNVCTLLYDSKNNLEDKLSQTSG